MKAFFLTRHIREKILILALILGGVGYWGTSLFGRASAELANTKKLEADLKEQQDWIARKDQVEQHLQDQVKQLDPKQAGKVGTVISAIEAILTDLQIDLTSMPTPAPPTTVRSTLMTVSTQKITLNNIGMQDLLSIYRALSKLAPFVDIESMTIQVNNQRGFNNRGRQGAGGGPNGQFALGAANPNQQRGARGGRGAAAAPNLPVNQPPPAVGSRLNAVFTLQGVALNSARGARPAAAPRALPAATTGTSG
jgi:hypothetical protein